MVEHPGRNCAVEVPISERDRLHVPDARIDAPRPCQLDHPLGLVERDQLGARLRKDASRELAAPAADLEHAARPRFRHGAEGDFARVGAGRGLPGCRAHGETRFVGVLVANELGIVERSQGATIGCPGIPRGGGFPPSQAFTVAPTSANSPSWIRPAAFFPWT